MMIQRIVLAFALATLFAGCTDKPAEQSVSVVKKDPAPPAAIPPVLVDVHRIASRTQEEIAESFGQPRSCDTNSNGEMCSYDSPQMQVYFLAGKAQRISILNLRTLKFSPSALVAIGLKDEKPDFANESVMRWENHFGLNEVMLFPNGEMADYAHIKVHQE